MLRLVDILRFWLTRCLIGKRTVIANANLPVRTQINYAYGSLFMGNTLSGDVYYHGFDPAVADKDPVITNVGNVDEARQYYIVSSVLIIATVVLSVVFSLRNNLQSLERVKRMKMRSVQRDMEG